MILFGTPNIEKLKANNDIRGLIKAIKHKQESVRNAAFNALQQVRSIHAVKPLILSVKESERHNNKEIITALVRPLNNVLRAADIDHDDKRYIIKALGRIGDARSVFPIIPFLKDKSLFIRNEAIEALERISDERAIKPLVSNLDDYAWGIKPRVIDLLNNLGWEPDGFESVNFFINILNENFQGSNRRIAAAKKLAQIGAPQSLIPLAITAIKKEPNEYRDNDLALSNRELRTDHRGRDHRGRVLIYWRP